MPSSADRHDTNALPLVGRAAELGRIDDLLGDVASGRGGASTLVGPAGSGKTALLGAARGRAQDAGITVIDVAGVAEEADLPWAALATVCLSYARLFERLPGPQQRAMRAALALDDSDQPVDRLAVSLGALSTLSAASREAPLLVVVDDLPWVDPESRTAFGFVARRIGDDPIGILAAARPDAVDPLGDAIAVSELSEGEVQELVGQAGVKPHSVRESIAAAADGNPLVAIGLAGQLSADQRAGSAPLPDALPLPTDVDALYRARIEQLPPRTHTALLLLALNTNPDPAVLERALAQAEPTLDDLEPATEADLVSGSGVQARFVHPLVRHAVSQSATDEQRRAAHLLLAEAEGPYRERGVLHRAAAATGPDPDLAQALADEAGRAERRGAPRVALHRWSRAAELSDEDQRRPRLVAAARAALAGGEAQRAAALAAQATGGRGEPVDLETCRVQVRLAVQAGDFERARELADAGDAAFAGEQPAAVAGLLGEVVRPALVLDPAAAVPLSERVWDLAKDAPPPTQWYASILYGCGRFLAGDAAAAEKYTACWPELLDLEGPVAAGAFLAETVGVYLPYSNRRPEVGPLLDRLEPAMRKACTPEALLSVISARCLAAFGTDLRASVAAGREAVALATEVGQPGLSKIAHTTLAQAVAAVGDHRLMALVTGALLSEGDATSIAAARAALIRQALIVGRSDEAAAEFDRLNEEIGPGNPSPVQFEPDAIEALVRAGRPEDARALLPAVERYAEVSPWGVAMLDRSKALLARDLDEAETHLADARDAISHLDNFIARGVIELAWGERLRRAKRKAAARPHLEQAIEHFAAVGADAFRERAEQELAAAGGTTDRSRPTDELLSATELQIARLVASGATNRDVAGQLFLSPRTVENRLTVIYRKLGVPGRAGLLTRAGNDPALRASDVEARSRSTLRHSVAG